jgi:PAS domain S-box-containing protein
MAQARISDLEEQLRWAQGRSTQRLLPLPGAAVESITVAFTALDREFRFVWVNAEAERLLKIPAEKLLGRGIREVFPEPADTIVEEKCRESISSQKLIEFEWFSSDRGSWFFHRVYPTENGGVAMYWQEITEQKTAEAKLRRQAMELEQAYDAIIVTDLDGKITRWNQGAQRIYGYEANEVIGQNIQILYFAEDHIALGSNIIQSPLRDERKEQRVRARRKSGEEAYVRLATSLLRDANHELYEMLVVAIDITEQQRSEQALRVSEQRYRELVEAIPQLAFITNADGTSTLVNRHWEEYSGAPKEECLEFGLLSWVHPEERTDYLSRWLECLRSGDCFEREYRLRNKDGVYRWHFVRALPVRTEAGEIAHWVGTFIDIHARKEAEEALSNREERFRLACQAVQGIVYDWDIKTGVVQRSGSLEELTGIRAEHVEPTESWWQSRLHPDDAARSTLNGIRRLTSDKNQFETDFRFKHANGDWIYLSDHGFVVRDENGDAVRVVGSTEDITERKRLEEALKERNKELRFQADILEATTDAVIALDPKLCVRYCNAAAERMYGVKLADVKGKPLPTMHGYAWLAPEDEQKFLADWAERGSWKGEYIHILRDQTQLIVQSTVNKLTEEAGGGMVAVIRDITERKHAELRTRNQAAQLASANEDLLHFAYAVSHDLRAPLRTITSFSQLLSLKYKQNLDQRANEFISWIVDASTRMDTMLRDLLQYAKAAGAEAVLEKVDLQEALSTAMESVRGALQEAQGTITHDVLPHVEANTGQLAELFENLIGNALKYRKPDVPPQIHISASRTDREWTIAVRDNGVGFEAKDSERIFRVFERLYGREFSGTGIGLTICKRIVERRGGKIWADATPGVGATFYFTIPDSTPVIPAAPPMEWLKLPGVLENGELANKMAVPTSHFDELFKALDLAQAIVRRLDGTILIWTKGVERLFGWTQSEALGKRLHELMGTEFHMAQKAVESVLLSDGEWAGELKAHKKDGSTVWLATHTVLYRDGSGRPESVIEMHNDITALKNAEEALRRSSEQRDLALVAAKMGIWRWDSRTGVVEWSETLETIFGLTPGSFEGTSEAFQKRIHPDDWPATQDAIAKAFEAGGNYVVEHRLLKNDGSYCWARGQGKVVLDDLHLPVGLVGVVWDITAAKQAEG